MTETHGRAEQARSIFHMKAVLRPPLRDATSHRHRRRGKLGH